MRKQALTLVAMALLGVASVANGAVTLAGYPAPGGNAASGIGTSTLAGGRTWTLTAFNPSAYDELYYVVGTGPQLWTDNTPDTLSFSAGLSSLATGVAVWAGATILSVWNGFAFQDYAVGTRFTLTTTDLLSNPLALTSAGSIPGIPAALGAALAVPASGFRANWFFELQNPFTTTYGAAKTVYDALSTNPSFNLSNSVGGAFYASPPVPLPAAVWLLLSGLAGLGVMGRRRATA